MEAKTINVHYGCGRILTKYHYNPPPANEVDLDMTDHRVVLVLKRWNEVSRSGTSWLQPHIGQKQETYYLIDPYFKRRSNLILNETEEVALLACRFIRFD